MTSNEKNILKIVSYILRTMLGIGMIIYSGWILTFLWAWFIIPITNYSPLSIAHACGISLMISFTRFNPSTHLREYNHIGKGDDNEPWVILLLGFTADTFVFGLAWVMKGFMS